VEGPDGLPQVTLPAVTIQDVFSLLPAALALTILIYADEISTAAEALGNVDADLDRLGVEVWLARANGPLRHLLAVTGLTPRIGAEHIYPAVRAAVAAFQARFPGASRSDLVVRQS
jgi:MFS superfamily sulfate permease-like transporter